MTAVFLLRHPQTTWNAEHRYQGRLEAPVSREGAAQSRLVARAFAGFSLAAVYSSPLRRALRLAQEVAQATDAPLVVEERFGEIAMGPWEGLYRAEIEERFPAIFANWYRNPASAQFPGGESARQVQVRASSALEDIFREHRDSSVGVVTHSVVVQTLAASALALDLDHIHGLQVGNASVTTLCGTSAPGRLLALNDLEPLYQSPGGVAAAENCVS